MLRRNSYAHAHVLCNLAFGGNFNITILSLTDLRSREMPLPIYTPCKRVDDGTAEDYLEFVLQYFWQGYSNLEILEFPKLHGVSISTLKRRLSSLTRIIKKNYLMMN